MKASEQFSKKSFLDLSTGLSKQTALDEQSGNSTFLRLVDWCNDNPNRRGLERYSSLEHYAARDLLVRKNFDAVLKLNDKYKHAELNNNSYSTEQRDENANEMRRVSEQKSQ